jgi:hypothetical protein
MNGCCHNESEHFQLREDFIPTIEHSNFNHLTVVDLNILYHILIDTNVPGELISHKNLVKNESPPPGEIHSILSQLQSYLL